MRKQVEAWKATRIPDEAAKLVIYRAFVECELDIPKHLPRRVRRNRRRLPSNGFIERARSTLRELRSIRRCRMGLTFFQNTRPPRRNCCNPPLHVVLFFAAWLTVCVRRVPLKSKINLWFSIEETQATVSLVAWTGGAEWAREN